MVLLLRRELLILGKLRILFAAALVALSAACGGNTGASEDGGGNTNAYEGTGSAGEQTPAARAPAGARSATLENGDPMPPAEENGGVPPYPGAVVWTVVPPPPSEFHVVNAFTPDTFPMVVEFYDQALADWRRTVAKDAVHYHRDPNIASVIVAPWSGEKMGEEGPEELLETRTSIGIAWQEGP